jgi:serine/threonine protein kinase
LIQPEEYVAGSANVMGIAKGLFDIAANELDPNRDSSTGILAKDSNMPAILDYANQNPDDLRGRWTNKSMVGKGAFGYVWKSEERSSGMIFARKSMHYGTTGNKIKDEQEKAEREVLWEIEVEIMQQLRHVHITTVFFTLKEPSSFDIMMLPLADTNMGTFLEDCGDRRRLEARRKYIPEWMGCLTNALAFAHEQKIRHKDIKPANILVKGNQVFLSDFGLAVSFTDADVSFTTNDPGGTWKYKAPESEIGVPHGRAADIFGLGCVFSEMLTVFNFKSVSSFEKSRRLSGPPDIYFRTNLETTEQWILALRGNATSDFLAEVITNMLQLDPKLRKHADELKNEFESREGFCCSACRLRQA